ncbi:MAG: hypothetical protein ABUK01_18720 [Leptospirales bacterium]
MSEVERGKRGPLFYLIGVLALPLSVFAFIAYYNKSSVQDMYDTQYRYNVKTEHVYIYWTPPKTIAGADKVHLAGKIARLFRETAQENNNGIYKNKILKDGVYVYSLVSDNADLLYESLSHAFQSYPELAGSRVRLEYDRDSPPFFSEFNI